MGDEKAEYELHLVEESLIKRPLDRDLHFRRLQLLQSLDREVSVLLGALHESASQLSDPYFMQAYALALEGASRHRGTTFEGRYILAREPQAGFLDEALHWYRRAADLDNRLARELPEILSRIEVEKHEFSLRLRQHQLRSSLSALRSFAPSTPEEDEEREELLRLLEGFDLVRDPHQQLLRLLQRSEEFQFRRFGIDLQDSLRKARREAYRKSNTEDREQGPGKPRWRIAPRRPEDTPPGPEGESS